MGCAAQTTSYTPIPQEFRRILGGFPLVVRTDLTTSGNLFLPTNDDALGRLPDLASSTDGERQGL
jgi:hypothetical protein